MCLQMMVSPPPGDPRPLWLIAPLREKGGSCSKPVLGFRRQSGWAWGEGGQGRCTERQEQEQALDPVSWMPSPARALIHGGPGPGNGGVLFPLYARLMTASWFGMDNFILQIRLLKVRERNNFPKVPQNCLQTPSSYCKPLLRQHLLPSPWLSQLNEERRGPRCL